MHKRLLFGILALVTVGALYAGGLSRKYKDWPGTPESYFMTRAEKATWKNIKTDEEAEKFVADYKASRGDDFFKSLDPSIAAADKYFSAGSVKGSRTLRGKVIIMFGPPSSISQSQGGDGKGGGPLNGSLGGGAKSGGGGGDALSSGVGGSPLSAPPPPIVNPTFSLTYNAQAAPKAIGKSFTIELNVISNSEQQPVDPEGLDEKFEVVARASIQKTKS